MVRAVCNENKTLAFYDVPYVGQVPAFNYRDVYSQPGLALNDVDGSYLYILRRPDKEHEGVPAPFYVGIGHERRFAYHYLESTGLGSYKDSINKNRHKFNTIRSVGRDNVVIQMFNLSSMDQAKFLEKELIAFWGRRDQNSGILTNMTDGGDGVLGLTMPDHVLDILRGMAKSPVKFAGKSYAGIIDVFEAHTPEQLAEILGEVFCIPVSDALYKAYCTDYGNFKALYSRWLEQGYSPYGFNYLNDGEPVLPEYSTEQIEEFKEINRHAGYENAWLTRYSYPKYRVPGGEFHTISDAAKQLGCSPANLVRKFRLMRNHDHFESGYNILDVDGNPIYQEQDVSLLQKTKEIARKFLSERNSKPILVNGVLVPNMKAAYALSEHARGGYPNFMSQVSRWEEFGAFPEGLNVAGPEGGLYPEIEPDLLLSDGRFEHYYVICGRRFFSCRSASLALGLKQHNTAWGYINKFKQKYETEGEPFPKGFNVYDTKTGRALYPEHPKVDPGTPISGVMYEGVRYDSMTKAAEAVGKTKSAISKFFKTRRKQFFEEDIGFEVGMNVLGLDGLPLYPLIVGKPRSKAIVSTNGRSMRHNGVETIEIFHENEWQPFIPIAKAWHSIPWLKERYKNADSFTNTLRKLEKNGKLYDWARFVT